MYSMRSLATMMADEYKEEYPDESDPSTNLAFMQGYQGMKSDSIDYYLHSDQTYPLTIALFYDSRDLDDEIIAYLATRLLDIYILKKEKILKKGGNLQALFRNTATTQAYEASLPLIFENVSLVFLTLLCCVC